MKKFLSIFLSLSIVLVCSLSTQACSEKNNDSQALQTEIFTPKWRLIPPAFADGDGTISAGPTCASSPCIDSRLPKCCSKADGSGYGCCPNTHSCGLTSDGYPYCIPPPTTPTPSPAPSDNNGCAKDLISGLCKNEGATCKRSNGQEGECVSNQRTLNCECNKR